MEILYEDKDMLLCVKAAGVPVQSDKTFERDMVSEILLREREMGEELFCSPINRLDKPVEGIVLFAKTPMMAALLSNTEYKKMYLAVTFGRIEETSGKFVDYIKKDGKENISKIVDKNEKGGKYSELSYEVVGYKNVDDKELTCVRIQLKTGRHHQIRVQFSHRGYPLYGDRKYGDKGSIKRDVNVALCAYGLEFIHPLTKERMSFTIVPKAEIFGEFITE